MSEKSKGLPGSREEPRIITPYQEMEASPQPEPAKSPEAAPVLTEQSIVQATEAGPDAAKVAQSAGFTPNPDMEMKLAQPQIGQLTDAQKAEAAAPMLGVQPSPALENELQRIEPPEEVKPAP